MSKSLNLAIVPEAIANPCYDLLLNAMPDEWRERLAIYTLEELFYVYNLMHDCPKDAFFLGLKAKQLAYLQGVKRPGAYGVMTCTTPIYGTTWAKLGYKWRHAWNEFLSSHGTEYNVQVLKDLVNRQRIA